MANEQYVLVEKGGVTVEYSQDGNTYTTLGCLKGTLTINDAVAVVEDQVDNWCTAVVIALATASQGNRTISLAGTLELIPSDTTTWTAHQDYEDGNTGYVKITATDEEGSPTSRVFEYSGIWTQFNKQFNQTGTSDMPFAFRVNDIIQDGS